jgi:16S rRNA U1498 N3-methylase RsmE
MAASRKAHLRRRRGSPCRPAAESPAEGPSASGAAAALGVGHHLTNAARVERNYFDTHLLEPSGFRPLLLEGLQQARDTQLPIVSVHRQFRILVEDHLDALAGASLRLVADPSAGEPIAGIVARQERERLLLAIGPGG